MHAIAEKVHALLQVHFGQQLVEKDEGKTLFPTFQVLMKGARYPCVLVYFEESRWDRKRPDNERKPIAVRVRYSGPDRDRTTRYTINADGWISEEKFVARVRAGLDALEQKREQFRQQEDFREERRRQDEKLKLELKQAGFDEIAGICRQERDGVAFYSGSINVSSFTLTQLLALLTVAKRKEVTS